VRKEVEIPDPQQYPGATRPGNDYYEKIYDRTLLEWRKFMAGDASVDPSIVPRVIADSWIRCREMGMDPFAKPLHKVLSGDELEGLLEENKHFINVSRLIVGNLFEVVRTPTPPAVSIYDERGFLLDIFIEDKFREAMDKVRWVVGALWDEATSGTGAVGTVLTLRRPVSVFGAQHYLRFHHRDIGCGAPVFGPGGDLLGGIIVHGLYYGANPYILGTTVAAAKAIENVIQAERAMKKEQIASSFQKAVISSIPEAIIAVDREGCISLINEKAEKMFLLDAGRREGEPVRLVFGPGNQRFLSLIENDGVVSDVEVRIFSRKRSNDFTLTTKHILSPQGEIIGKILVLTEIKKVNTLITKMIGAKANFSFDDIRGGNPVFLKTIEQARIASASSSNVLLLGKSGTGKDIFAQAIHNASSRKNGPYVAINCAAIPIDLITSELFGYEEGAFTGSRRGGNQGKFELADGGTIFLDEISETPLELQAALLRVIEDKCVVRIGDKHIRPVDVRIIAATNADLREQVRRGSFREDLYYRLNVFAIHLIPLSDRPEDIRVLTDCFVNKYEKILDKKIVRIDPALRSILSCYPWPGNVRELQNVIERMMNIVRTSELTADLIPAEISEGLRLEDNIEAIDFPEESAIRNLLRLGVSKSQIAKQMKVSRMTLYRKIEKYNL
jgi:sigma-54 dependent transcriptional regulator, acetoin dehydrogenase operon transcriptional activator AcoR